MLGFRDFAAFGLSEPPPCTTPAYGWTRPTVHPHLAPSPRSATVRAGCSTASRGRVASGKDANRPELVAARHALASGLVGGLVGSPGWTDCPGPSRTSRGCSTRPRKRSGVRRPSARRAVVQLAVEVSTPRSKTTRECGERKRQHRWSRAESERPRAVDGPGPLWPVEGGLTGVGRCLAMGAGGRQRVVP